MANKYGLSAREGGEWNIFGEYETEEEAHKALAENEAEDQEQGTYEPEYYIITTKTI